MAKYGLTSAGFRVKSFSAIQTDIHNDLLTKVDPKLNLSGDSVIGQLTNIFSHHLSELWQGAAALYHSLDTDVAEGTSLDALSSLTGTKRLPNESDRELRIRRYLDLKAKGRCTKAALLSNLKVLPGVRSVVINNGVNEFQCLVLGGEDAAIQEVIEANTPLGIKAKFKRPKPVNIKLHLLLNSKLEMDPKVIKQSLLDHAKKHFLIGSQVYPSQLYAPILQHDAVVDIKGLAAEPNRVLDAHEYAVIEEVNFD